MRVLAVAQEKGGTGKTTSAVTLGALAHAAGSRTLVIDMDPQAMVVTALRLSVEEDQPTMTDVLVGNGAGERLALAEVLIDSGHGPHLAPASKELALFDARDPHAGDWRFLLRRALDPVEHLYDVVLIDCPPGFGPLLSMALFASDEVVVPTVPAFLDYRAVEKVRDTIRAVSAARGRDLRFAGVLPTKVERLATHRTVLGLLADLYPGQILPPIPKAAAAADAPFNGLPLHRYAPKSPATLAYIDAARQLGLVPKNWMQAQR